MSTSVAANSSPESPAEIGRDIGDWRPEDPRFWADTGAGVARRNLIWSILTEHIGISVWSIWSVLVLFMGPKYGVDPAGKFLLTAVPALVGSMLRLPYTFAVAKFGGRNWTMFSALVLLAPVIATALVFKPGVSYTTLLLVAALAGFGGGNIGVAGVQLVGLLVLATAGKTHPRLVLGIYDRLGR